jgi:hypothetical protein
MTRLPYVWDYDIDEATFGEILAGRTQLGRLDQDWAVTIEQDSYAAGLA